MDKSNTSRQKQIFLKDPILKAILRVSLPAIAIAFMAGLYVFADQILMVNLIPRFLTGNDIYGTDIWTKFQQIIVNNPTVNITNYDTSSIIRTAVAYSAPVTILINAAALLIGNGAAINYNRKTGGNKLVDAQKIWTLAFWSNLFWSLIVCVFIICFAQVLVNLQQGNELSKTLDALKDKLSANDYAIVSQVYTKAYEVSNNYATMFIYIIGGGAICAIYAQFLGFLIIAESRQIFVVCSSIVCNVINILLDWIFIQFAKLAIIGGATAMVIGWTLNCCSYIWYIWFMNFKNQTNLSLSALKHMNWNKRTMWSIFSLGLPSFVRNISMAISSTLQMAFLAFLIGRLSSATQQYSNADFQDIYGAVNPIYNLFYTALVGIINGARMTCAYNYGAGNMKRVRQSYWIVCIIGVIWGLICIGIISCGLINPLLSLFGINSDDKFKHSNAVYMLYIAMGSLPLFGAQIGGMMLFQATNKWWRAVIAGLMQGFICYCTIGPVVMAISLAINNIFLFLWAGFIVICFSVTITVIWSITFMYKHYTDDKGILWQLKEKS